MASNQIEDVLTYALFPQVGLKFLKNRGNPDAFEPAPGIEPAPTSAPPPKTAAVSAARGPESYTVRVDGRDYSVTVSAGGEIQNLAPAAAAIATTSPDTGGGGEPLPAPLAGNIFKINVTVGQSVNSGDVVMIMEAMKMETEVRATRAGTVSSLTVKEGDAVQVGDTLIINEDN